MFSFYTKIQKKNVKMDRFTLEDFCTLFKDVISKENCTCQNPEVFNLIPSCTNGSLSPSTTPTVVYRQSEDFDFRLGLASVSITFGVTGLLANGYILTKHGRKWKELANSQILILYLAIANLLYTISFLVPSITSLWATSWILGEPLCKLFMSLRPVGSSLSIGLVAVIAYERYVGITKPLSILTDRKITCLVLTNIIIAIGSTTPNYLYARIHQSLGKCEHKWPNNEIGLIYNTFYLFVPTLATVALTFIFYFKINCTLTHAIRKDNFLQSSIQKKSFEQKVKQTIKIGRIIKVIIITFTIMVPPYQICYIILLATGYVNMTLFKIMTFISVPIFQAHVALHPFLFGGMHKEAIRWVRSFCRRTRRLLGISIATYEVNRNTIQTSNTTEASCVSDSSRTDSFNG